MLRKSYLIAICCVFLTIPLFIGVSYGNYFLVTSGTLLIMTIPSLFISLRLTQNKILEAIILTCPLSWTLLPLLILINFLLPLWSAYSIYLTILIIASFFVKWPKLSLKFDLNSSLLVALIFFILVAIPFCKFFPNNIVRELWIDGHQRFGVAYSLYQLPPENHFAAGIPLRYYWFSFYPLSLIYYHFLPNMFSVWKVFLLFQSFFFVLTIYILLKGIYPHKRVALWSISFLFIFSSFEFFIRLKFWEHLLLFSKLPFKEWLFSLKDFFTVLDPDHVAGIVVAYSDQLLWEDFVYIPQNFVAVLLSLFSFFLLKKRLFLASVFVGSLLAAYNTFYLVVLLPVLFICLWCAGIPYPKLLGLGLMSSGVIFILFRIVNILDGILILWISLLLIISGLLLLQIFKDGARRHRPNISRTALIISILSLLLLIFTRPEIVRNNFIIMTANYGPAFICLAIFFYLYLRKKRLKFNYTLIGLLLFMSLFFIISAFLIAGYKGLLPHFGNELAYRIGFYLNIFNFYHKTAKFIRVIICFLGALGLCWVYPLIAKHKILKVGAIILIILSLPTTLIRPLTYFKNEPVAEASLNEWLNENSKAGERYLTQKYERDYLHQLNPLAAFYVCDWKGGNISLTHISGSWADQYVSLKYISQLKERERLVNKFFKTKDSSWQKMFLINNNIRYVLSLKELDEDFLLLRVRKEGLFLYEFKT